MSKFYDESYAQTTNEMSATRSGFYTEFSGRIDYHGNAATVENATFQLTKGGDILFYDGTWKDGTWKSGTFKGGTWLAGVFLGGVWEGGMFTDGTIKGGIFLNGKIKNAVDATGAKVTSKAKINAATRKAEKLANKALDKMKKAVDKTAKGGKLKDMFDRKVKEWMDKHLSVTEYLEFNNYVYKGRVALKCHTPEADAYFKSYIENFKPSADDVRTMKEKYCDAVYMFAGSNSGFVGRAKNINFYGTDAVEYLRWIPTKGFDWNSRSNWKSPSTATNDYCWEYLFQEYFANRLPKHLSYINDAMNGILKECFEYGISNGCC